MSTPLLPSLDGLFEFFSVDRGVVDRLSDEADQYEPKAHLVDSQRCFIDDNGALRTSRKFHVSGGGDVLADIHENEIQALVNAVIGRQAYPTRASYLYYEPGDFLGPHQDVQQCQITVLLPLTAKSVIQIYSDDRSTDPTTLFDQFTTMSSQAEKDILLPLEQALVFSGTKIVHARRRTRLPVRTVTFCYGYDS